MTVTKSPTHGTTNPPSPQTPSHTSDPIVSMEKNHIPNQPYRQGSVTRGHHRQEKHETEIGGYALGMGTPGGEVIPAFYVDEATCSGYRGMGWDRPLRPPG